MSVSIVMATLAKTGWDKYLPSLLGQTVKADEIIIIIDRKTSVAERRALIARWPDVSFLFNDQNRGITASLNRGLYAAKGDYIFRADDDDWYRPDRIEKQLACFDKSGADLVCSWAAIRLGDDRAASYLERCPVDDSAIKQALKRRNILIHPSLAFRRKAILAIGGYDENFTYAQDYGLYLASIRAGYNFAAVPEPLVEKGMGEENITVINRYRQMQYSCAARVLHHAHDGDRIAFLRTAFHYALLTITPPWLRRFRRAMFALSGRGR